MKLTKDQLVKLSETIAQKTEVNDHCGALTSASLALESAGFEAMARSVETIRDVCGFVPNELSPFRQRLYESVNERGYHEYGSDWDIITSSM